MVFRRGMRRQLKINRSHRQMTAPTVTARAIRRLFLVVLGPLECLGPGSAEFISAIGAVDGVVAAEARGGLPRRSR